MQRLVLAPGEVYRYGLVFSPHADGFPLNALEIELLCFLRGGTAGMGSQEPTDKYFHCERAVRLLWPKMDYHEWLEELLVEFCRTSFTGATGSANSGKSWGTAVYCLLDWYADPVNTLSFVISTNKVDAKQRIWGHIEELHADAISRLKLPGRLMPSIDAIALRDLEKGQEGTNKSQIILVAGGEADAVQRLQGKKNKRVRVYCDEGQDVNQALGKAIFNLNENQDFQCRVLGNPSSPYDFHGKWCEPIKELGGHALEMEDRKTWPILAMGLYAGTCIHFNNIRSPNFKRQELGLPLIPYLPRPEQVLLIRRNLGRDDPVLWRQHIGVWSKGGGVRQTVFTEAELSKFKVSESCQFITSKRGFGIDPAYTEHGDSFALRPFDWGACTDGVSRILFHPVIYIPDAPYYEEDGQEYRGPFARAKRVRDLANEHGVSAEFIGEDDTGRNPIKQILDTELGGDTLGVGFGDGASEDINVSLDDETPSKDAYADLGTEMWYGLREFAEYDQVRGISDAATLRQLANRKFQTRARGKVRLESKKDFKLRMGGKSPDEADCTAVCVAVVRKRMGGLAGLAVVQERAAVHRQEARPFQRIQPARLSGQRGVGRLTYGR